jgi:hypothetical protein
MRPAMERHVEELRSSLIESNRGAGQRAPAA